MGETEWNTNATQDLEYNISLTADHTREEDVRVRDAPRRYTKTLSTSVWQEKRELWREREERSVAKANQKFVLSSSTPQMQQS